MKKIETEYFPTIHASVFSVNVQEDIMELV